MEHCLKNNSNIFQDRTQTAIGVIYMIYAPVIVFVNVILIVSMIATNQSLKKSSNLLIVCLSISDALIGALLMPVLSIRSLWYNSPKICLLRIVSWYLQLYLHGVSSITTLLLALDRYMHMNPNFQSSTSKLSKSFKVPYIYLTIFVVCLLPGAVILTSLHFTAQQVPEAPSYFQAFYAISLLMAIMFFTALYTRGYLRIRHHVANNPIYARRGEDNSNEVPAYVDKLFKTVLILLVAMTISWVPSLVMYGIMTIGSFMAKPLINPDTSLILDSIAILLSYGNSAFNALIVLYRDEKSRDWLRGKFCHLREIETVEPNVANPNSNMRNSGV